MVQKKVVTPIPDDEAPEGQTPRDVLQEAFEKLTEVTGGQDDSVVFRLGRLLAELRRFSKSCSVRWAEVEEAAREELRVGKIEKEKKGIVNRKDTARVERPTREVTEEEWDVLYQDRLMELDTTMPGGAQGARPYMDDVKIKGDG